MSVDLQKLTVPQLKTLCKEKGIVGYSKLSKSALVEKLAAHGRNCAGNPTQTGKDTTAHNKQQEKPPTQGKEKKKPFETQVLQIPMAIPSVEISKEVDCQNTHGSLLHFSQAHTTADSRRSVDALQPPEGRTDISQASWPDVRTTKEIEPPSKRQKLGHRPNQQPLVVGKSQKLVEAQAKATFHRTAPLVNKPAQKNDQTVVHIPRGTAVASKRYIPLAVKLKNPVMPVAVAQSAVTIHGGLSSPGEQAPSEYLDFPLPDESNLSFKAITHPPSLSKRQYASKLAILLRDVRREDMLSLTLTSRLFRYSGYLSAAVHLKRWYPGKRLEKVLVDISADRMNLWPYRLLREDECRRRKDIFRGSVLGRLVGGDVGNIAESVWKSGDDSREAVVAVRFLLTRCYFCVSLNRDLVEIRGYKVVEVQEILPSEIWSVVVEARDGGQMSNKFYVLEATCEVIGNPVALDGRLPTRTDWSGYIQKHISEGDSAKAMDIMNHIRWTNYEEYDRGISKIWLKGTQEEKELGKLKREVARRYIIACTMENSLSGRYMTWHEMEQELNGLPGKMMVQSVREQRVNLFVPAHHHVESVHFTTASQRPLHPALAVIQTPSREYFILKDNGMEVGCEEEGVGEVWMEVIGCSPRGEAVKG